MSLWSAFEHLGLLDRYESLISSVCYEQIEEHILSTCGEQWADPMLAGLREWMSERIVPWMLLPYARGARNCKHHIDVRLWLIVLIIAVFSAEEAKVMLQGVGSRFDFHMCKTLCDLRYALRILCLVVLYQFYIRTREIFDIIIDYPDSMGALQDLKVQQFDRLVELVN